MEANALTEDVEKMVNTLSDILQPPHHLVQEQFRGIYVFGMHHCPGETVSDDDPPVRLRDDAECIPIDGFLGRYTPHDQRITLYNKGIARASEILKVDPHDLKHIVRIHEYAHAIVHLGLTDEENLAILKDENLWPPHLESSTAAFEHIETAVHEKIAQLITLRSIQSQHKNASTEEGKEVLSRIEKIFHQLARRQGPEYQIHDLLDIPHHRIVQSLQLMKGGALSGQFETWKQIISW